MADDKPEVEEWLARLQDSKRVIADTFADKESVFEPRGSAVPQGDDGPVRMLNAMLVWVPPPPEASAQGSKSVP